MFCEQDIIKIKAELFCKGVRLSSDCPLPLPYLPNKRASLSEGKCFILMPSQGGFPINVAVRERFVKNSPFLFSSAEKKILKEGTPYVEAEDIKEPEWYNWRLPKGKRFSEVIQIHLKNILATALSDFCVFKARGEGCKYCALRTGPESRNKVPQEIAYCISRLESEGYKYSELNLNAGTLPGEDRGASLYIETIQEVKKVSNISISAQICPPEDLTWINKFYEAGLNTISFNLEIYDNEYRKEICPGKFAISRERYLEALNYAVKIFGKNQVSSWLIIGLESVETTIAGVEMIAATGAIPFVSVFRPLTGTVLEQRLPPRVEDVVEVFTKTGKILKKYGLNPHNSINGCVRCNCCSALLEVVEKVS